MPVATISPVADDQVNLPKWASAFLVELPATTERIADVFGIEDHEAAAGLAHLEAAKWVVPLPGRGSRVWHPIGPQAASDTSRPIGARVLALLPATVSQLRGAMPDLTGRQISSALTAQNGAVRVRRDGEVWHRVPAPRVPT